jgi:hypothetical protein
MTKCSTKLSQGPTIIVIEDHSEDAEESTNKKARKYPLHKKPAERGKDTSPLPT